MSRMTGTGLLKGLIVTARNFFGSYVDKERLITQQYPEEKHPPKENFRNVPFLLYDGEDPIKGMRCVACKICEQECPPQCIYIECTFDAEGNSLKTPKVFDIDFTVCMNCGICAEACPFDAIKMDNDFELASFDRFGGQLADLHRLLKSNEYYKKIKPTEAGEVDARLEAKAKKAAAKTAPKPAAPAATAPTPAAAKAPPAASPPKPAPPPPAAPPGGVEAIAPPSADAPPLPPAPSSNLPVAAAPPSAAAPPLPPPPSSNPPVAAAPPPPPPPPGGVEAIAPPSADAPALPPAPASNPPLTAAAPPPPPPPPPPEPEKKS